MTKLDSSQISLRSLYAAVAGLSALAGVAVVWGSLTLLGWDRSEVRRPPNAAQTSQRLAAAVDHGVYDAVQDLKSLTLALKRVSPGLDADELQPILSAWLGLRPDYAELNLVGANGRVKVAGNDLGYGQDVSGRAWFLRNRASRGIVAVPSAGTGGRTGFDIAVPVPGAAQGGEDILVARLNEAWLSGIQDAVLGASAGPVGATNLAILAPDVRSGPGLPANRPAGGREIAEQATPSAGYRDLAPSGWLAVARVQNPESSSRIDALLPEGRNLTLWLAVCGLAACAGWIIAGRLVRRLRLIGGSESSLSSPSRIAELRAHNDQLAVRERRGVRALQETRSALSRIRERLRTFEAMSGWTYWEIDMEAGSVTWTDPATGSLNAASDRVVALADLSDGIDPEDRDLMAFTMQAALDQTGPHDVVLRTTGTLAQNGRRRLFVRFIRAEGDAPAGRSPMLHALSREYVGESGMDRDFADEAASAAGSQRRDSDVPLEARSGTILRKVVDGVIHDFNNVLTVIIASLGTLQRRHDFGPDQARLVDAALAGAQRGSSLTRRLVNFVRQDETGLQETDVAEALAACVPFLGANVLHQTPIRTRVRPGLAKVLCSEKVLEAVLLNLAFHVRDIGSDGFAIGADERMLPEDGGIALPPGRYIRIILASGTPARHVTEVQSTEAGPTKAVAGLLAQVGGGFRLLADGSRGTGFLAELWLPAGRTSDEAAAESGGPTRSLRVLLVDSDSLVRQSFADALADLGHVVTQAGSAEHALALLEGSANYEAMIADWAMPAMSGLQLAATLTERHPHIRVILASPSGQLPASARAFLHIEKPFLYAHLAGVMRTAAQAATAVAA